MKDISKKDHDNTMYYKHGIQYHNISKGFHGYIK